MPLDLNQSLRYKKAFTLLLFGALFMQWWNYRKLAISLIAASFSIISYSESSVCDVLQKISLRATESKSDVVLIVHEGNVIGSYGAGEQYKPIELGSITKSFVSLAIGLLLQEDNLCSIDQPVYDFYPEWRQGNKQLVTIRQLLTHTSGMEAEVNSAEIYAFPDAVKMALATDFSASPGTRFEFNNKAANLLAGIVEKASGMNIQNYLRTRLFIPMGIKSDTWLCDPAGHPYGMANLTMNATDLAKIGMMLASDGCWNCKRLLSKDWVDAIMWPSQTFTPFYSMLWWLDFYSLNLFWDSALIDFYEQAGLPEKYICALKSMHGYVVTIGCFSSFKNFQAQAASHLASYFGSEEEVYNFFAILQSSGLPLGRWEAGPLRAVSAHGLFGQQLIVVPRQDLIAVRLTTVPCDGIEPEDTFADLDSLVNQLVDELELCEEKQASKKTKKQVYQEDNECNCNYLEKPPVPCQFQQLEPCFQSCDERAYQHPKRKEHFFQSSFNGIKPEGEEQDIYQFNSKFEGVNTQESAEEQKEGSVKEVPAKETPVETPPKEEVKPIEPVEPPKNDATSVEPISATPTEDATPTEEEASSVETPPSESTETETPQVEKAEPETVRIEAPVEVSPPVVAPSPDVKSVEREHPVTMQRGYPDEVSANDMHGTFQEEQNSQAISEAVVIIPDLIDLQDEITENEVNNLDEYDVEQLLNEIDQNLEHHGS